MVTVYKDREALSLAAAGLFAGEARRAVDRHGRFDVLLSGGETPRRMYQLLSLEPLRGKVPWRSVQFFWGDERFVPHDDPRSNLAMAKEALLDRLPLDEEQVHPVPFLESAKLSALAYERMLRGYFAEEPPRFDLVLLGLGENGHTASLFPGSEVLDEQERWVRDLYVAEQELYRVTLTPPALNQASLVAFLVSGGGKAAVLRELLEGEPQPERLPAALIKPRHGRLLWLVDAAAAAFLSQQTLL
jgi:6-phosphogluconolactonase